MGATAGAAGDAVTAGQTVKAALVVFVALLLQHTLIDAVRVDGAHPDLMLLLAVAAGYSAGPQRGAVFGFVVGLATDLLLPATATFGLWALVGCIIAFVSGVATAGLVRSSWWLPPVFFAAATAAGLTGYAILAAVLGQPDALSAYLPAALVVAVPAAVVLALPVLRAVAWALPARSAGAIAAGGR